MTTTRETAEQSQLRLVSIRNRLDRLIAITRSINDLSDATTGVQVSARMEALRIAQLPVASSQPPATIP